MAAEDLSTVDLPAAGFYTKRVTLNTTAGTAREVILPEWCRRMSVFIADATPTIGSGRIASSGSDDAAIGNDVQFITTAGLTWRRTAGRETRAGSAFITADAANSYAHLMLEQE